MQGGPCASLTTDGSGGDVKRRLPAGRRFAARPPEDRAWLLNADPTARRAAATNRPTRSRTRRDRTPATTPRSAVSAPTRSPKRATRRTRRATARRTRWRRRSGRRPIPRRKGAGGW